MALYLLPLFLVFVPFIISKYWKKYRQTCDIPPGPRGLPLIGNLHQFDTTSPHLCLWRLSQKYGPLMSLKLGLLPAIVISSASVVEEVFNAHDRNFSGRPTFVAYQKLSYNGLDMVFSTYNDHWRNIRKLCTLHLFNSKTSQSFRPIREEEVARMITKIHDWATNSCKPVDLSEAAHSAAGSIICRITFGKRYDVGVMNNKNTFEWLGSETQKTVVTSFLSDFFPMMGWIDKISGKLNKLEKSFEALDAFYQRLIDEHLSRSNASPDEDNHILDILLQMNEAKLSSSDNNKFDFVKAVLMNVIVAATDTSSTLAIWAMTLLMKNPAKMRKAQEEIRKLVGKKGRVEEDDIQHLNYVKAVIKETSRLCPPSPLLVPRQTTEMCVVQGYEIPPKTLVYINAWAIGRDPASWDNPQQFLPERFLINNRCAIDFKGQGFEMIPFGFGRRMCPGIFMGVATTGLILANLLYSFDWQLQDPAQQIDMTVKPGITMHKKIHLCLVPKLAMF